MKRPKPKYKIGQVLQQLDDDGVDGDFYAKVTHRFWETENGQWVYMFDLGWDQLAEYRVRRLTARERG